MTKLSLLSHADLDDVDDGIKINESFAKRFEVRKRKEEMGQLEDKYKAQLKKEGVLKHAKRQKERNEDSSDFTDSDSDYDSESDAIEDDFGEQVTPAIDAQILKTLAEIRSRSETIYTKEVDFFAPEQIKRLEEDWKSKHSGKNSQTKEVLPMVTLKDFHRERLLSGKANEATDEEDNADVPVITHVQEQEQLKLAMKNAFNTDDFAKEEEQENLFTTRQKTDKEIAREEEEYRQFLLENLASSTNAKESMLDWLTYRAEEDASVSGGSTKKVQFNNEDEFLMDYILNRGWVDKRSQKPPTYERLIAEDEADEDALEQADQFECAYNFRFEQPGGTEIQTFARTVEGSMRRNEETRRQKQRESAKTRKEEAKIRKNEELKRLKNLKMQEIKERVENLERFAGINVNDQQINEALADELANDEFDPEAHDRLMAKIIGEDFDGEDNKKPVFSSDSEFGEDLSKEIEAAKGVRKATKALKKVEKIIKKDSSESKKVKLADYLDEIYSMDYEDLIAGEIPCRFKYQRVEPSTFGIKIEDIMTADDSLLNSHVSIKKLAPYRSSVQQRQEAKKYGNKNRVHLFYKQLREKENDKKDEQ